MLSQINTAGAFYLAGKALVRKTQTDVVDSLAAPRYAGYIDVVASSLTNIALAAGTLLIPAATGPVGLVLAAKDAWLHRAEIRATAIKAKVAITAVLARKPKPKGGTLAEMKDWRDRSRAAREMPTC
jgi:hypothetical protein